MLEINGSIGGGQILRTSLSLSAITGKSFVIKDIRGNRPNPGIRPQHLQGIKKTGELCNAEVKGDKLNSKELKFEPGEITGKKIEAEIRTAGSIGLLLQTLLLPCSQAKDNTIINVDGGSTFSKWSPPVPYLEKVLKPILANLGFKFKIKVSRHGFYPVGGAKVKVEIFPWEDKSKIDLVSKQNLEEIKGESIASENLRNSNVAERQKAEAESIINNSGKEAKIEHSYVKSDCPGSGILLFARYETTVIGADSIGEKGKRSETVGREASKKLIKSIDSIECVDKYMGDQLLPYLSIINRKSSLIVPEVTKHIKTNLMTIKKFLEIKTQIKRNKITIKPS